MYHSSTKIISREELPPKVAFWRLKDRKIVFTNGCFDLLHLGHIDYLERAKKLGDVLVLGLNDDASVTRLKGKNRPLNSVEVRSRMLAALEFIDAVVVFEEDTPYELIKAVQPDILVKGSDYKVEEIVGHDIVLGRGGEVVPLDFVEGYSSTELMQKIKEL